jgi:hypothetical protein
VGFRAENDPDAATACRDNVSLRAPAGAGSFVGEKSSAVRLGSYFGSASNIQWVTMMFT